MYVTSAEPMQARDGSEGGVAKTSSCEVHVAPVTGLHVQAEHDRVSSNAAV